jgi:5-methylcytosine-specific restriction endonuclease McrA
MSDETPPETGIERGDLSKRLRAAGDDIKALAKGLADDVSREDFDPVLAEIEAVRRERFGPRPPAASGAGAKGRILQHLREHVGEQVYGEELAAISGIQEWARRVRELRVEDGFDIQEVGRSTYVLTSKEPDAERAAQWQLVDRIRNESGSARDRIGRFLSESVGQTVTRNQIDDVGKIKEGSRRLRELRDEHGWPIETHVDDPTLRPSEYRLLSTDRNDRRDPTQRLYPDALRQKVFERDNYTCQICGRNKEKAEAAGNARFYLELHHRVAIADEINSLPPGERNEPDNLITLCHSDHVRETEKLQKQKRRQRNKRR